MDDVRKAEEVARVMAMPGVDNGYYEGNELVIERSTPDGEVINPRVDD